MLEQDRYIMESEAANPDDVKVELEDDEHRKNEFKIGGNEK